jgi:predicted nucleic acid-binding protein
MYIIIDVNVFMEIFGHAQTCPSLLSEVYDRNRINVIYGGYLTEEYWRSESIRKIVITLDRAGKAKKINDRAVRNETIVVTEMDICVSDDQHVIALARVGESRLLCTNDTDLMKDFKNKKLINKPRGKIYNHDEHERMIKEILA